MTDEKEYQMLRYEFNLDSYGQDPYKRLPLILGLDESGHRMIMAKHQAAMVWARKESLKKASKEARERIYRKYVKGI